jgi:hypothetical protein
VTDAKKILSFFSRFEYVAVERRGDETNAMHKIGVVTSDA